MKDDLARPNRDDGAGRSGDRAARAAGPRHRIRPPGSMASRSRAAIWNWTDRCWASPDHGFGGVFDVNVFAILAALTHMDVEQNMNTTFLTHQSAWTLRLGKYIEPLGARPAVPTARLHHRR
jgi:hypothetical protein